MTISSNIRKTGPFVGNGVTVSLPFAFKVFATTDVRVVRLNTSTGLESDLVLTTDYSVSLNADQNANPGGTVNLVAPLPTGYTDVVTSLINETQGTQLTNLGGWYPKVVEDALDKVVILVQQLKERLGRSLSLPITASGVSVEMPAPEAGKAFGWDATGTRIVNIALQTGTSLVDLAASGGASLVGFIQGNGSGFVKRTAESKLRNFVDIRDFGAIGDGTSHPLSERYSTLAAAQVDYPHATSLANEIDWAAFQAANDYLESVGGGVCWTFAGDYQLNKKVTSDDHGVLFYGAGEGHYYGTVSAVTVATPATIIRYTGAGSEPLFHFTCTAGEYKKVGGGIERMFLHCGSGAGLATYGVLVTTRDKLTCRNLTIFNPTLAAVRTECYSGLLAAAGSGYDVQHCLFENVSSAIDSANTTARGLQLTGGQGNGGAGQGNTSFNTFINTRWASASTVPAVEIGDTDNNTFVALRANGGGVEEPITVGAIEFLSADQTGTGAARYNNIHGCEAVGGVFARASQTGGTSSFRNNIFGYNISNGGIAPGIQAGAGGSSDATLAVYYVDRMYAPAEIVLPKNAVVDFTATSNALPDARTVAYSKLGLVERGNLDGLSIAIEGTTTPGTATYTLKVGSYSRIGDVCFIRLLITWTGHTGTGDIRIKGAIPFLSVNDNRFPDLMVSASNLAFTAGAMVTARPEQHSKDLVLRQTVSGAASTGVPVDAAAAITVSGWVPLA